ncbi:helicase ARIP4-like isoform X2 [Denticeps clupeoides]|uniref:helicase ARIP4-like isoform X2 n=1 Tax=Denticeps clupeoides TaxID=299321 RepID=UPI0010A56023|nr:helicase ARIP4-like isoform X2 [Denticeps clupeoides]
MLLLDESDSLTDQSQSAAFSSENEALGGDSSGWHCTPPSTSPSGETPTKAPSGPPAQSDSHSPSLTLSGSKKRNSKPAYMRRNIRKLLQDHQLEAVTKAAHQEELERRRRLEQERENISLISPLHYTITSGDVSSILSSQVSKQDALCLDTRSSSTSASEDKGRKSQLTPHILKEDGTESTNKDEEDGELRSCPEESSVNHMNDNLLPYAQGHVLVNINHPANESDLYLAPQLARAIKPHQIDGVRFLYDNVVESLERYKNSSGFGCILAHSMGLGKTLQVISFIDILLRHTGAHTVLAIVPVNTLQNWLAEFNLWTPPPEACPPNSDPAYITPRTFKVHILNDEHKTTAARAKVVETWYKDGGVLLMGYEMYRLLSLKKCFVARRKKKVKKPCEPVIIDLDEEDRQQELLKGIEKSLSRPGPDVVICDEGHRIKNCHASTSQALKAIRTRRRVVLTGYPLQNNLMEYWCMVDFVRPDFLGTRQEFSNMFERPILNGQCVDSTAEDLQLMRYRSHVLHTLLEGFVQRRGHDVLRSQLPPKQEHVILVRLSALQKALYTEFMSRFQETGSSGWLSLNPLKAFCICCKIWNHPDVLYEALQKENLANEQDLDLDDLTTGQTRCHAPNRKGNPPEVAMGAMQEKVTQVITYEWAKEIMSEYSTGILENSAKMVLLFHLIDESVRNGDKILVFSQSLSTLTVIEEFLINRAMPNISSSGQNQKWIRNINYYRLDGSTSASERERLINQFNDPANNLTWVFLLSTRAGCLGVNLIGANRVVVFDASWNPCHDAQAVCRVYRYGQWKPCYIYRLVCDFTLEKKIYDRQISKQGMSDRVVDDLNPVLTFTRREVESLLHFVEEEPDSSQLLRPREDMEPVIRNVCECYPDLITKQPFHHESLLMDRRDLKLTKAEKKAAKKGYEQEKRASVPYTRPSYAHYYPASDQSLTNIPAFSQRNWRPPTQPENNPVANVRPAQSAPLMARRVPQGSTQSSTSSGSSSDTSVPVSYLQKAGVLVQKIVTTTDIVIPGTNSSKDVQARISAGDSIHIIRGTKGTYIWSSDGRIFAVRSAGRSKQDMENEATARGAVCPVGDAHSNSHANGGAFLDQKQLLPEVLSADAVARPLSPDSPEILNELQRYTKSHTPNPTAAAQGANHKWLLEDNGRDTRSKVSPAALNASNPLDLRGTKRSSFSPSDDSETPKKPVKTVKHAPTMSPHQGYPFTGAYGHNPTLHPTVNSTQWSMKSGSPYFQPQTSLADTKFMFSMTPDPFSVGSSSVPNSSPSSSASSSTTTGSPLSSSSSSTSLSRFMLRPGVAGMLPPGYHVSYGQPLGMYPNSLLPAGLPAAMSGPTGTSFLSHFPSSSPLVAMINNPLTGNNAVSSLDDIDEEDDDDVIEVMGK